MISLRRRLLAATVAPLALGGISLAAPALAQDGPAAADSAERVVVTARRRAESLQDTPVAVTVLSSQSLERQQILATTELDNVAPNLQFATYGTLTGNNSAAQVFIRGIGQTDATPAVDPGVGLYVDDVYLGRSVGGAMDFRDIASVQILRGPQGTLFGRNTIGGAVLLTSNAPGAGNTIRASVGEDNLYEVFGALDVPLGDTLAGRVSAGYRQRDGYVTRAFDGVDLGDENTFTLQGSLLWEPTDALSFTLRADYAEEDENGSPFVFNGINERAAFPAAQSVAAGCPGATFPPPFVPSTPDIRCANDAQALGPFTNGGTYPALSTLENFGASLVAEWQVNDVLSFKSITADRSIEWTGSRDADNTPLPILATNYSSQSDQISQELQALVDADRLHGVVGYYYFDEESFDRLIVPLGTPNPGGSYDTQRVALDSQAWAAFTHWTFDLTDALSVSAGLRYTEETKGLQATMFNVAPASASEPTPLPSTLCPTPAPTPGCLFITTDRFERDFSSTIGSASAQYRFNPALMGYVSWSQGFKSGGFNQRYNARPQASGEPLSFNDETAETYEIGFKSDPIENLTLNGAIFTTEYDDIQLTYRLGVVPLLFNAGVATIDGAELELTFAPTPDFRLDASLSYLDSSFDSINTPAPVGGVTPTAIATLDSKLPFAPESQGHVGASYTFHPRGDLLLTPRLDVSYTDSQFFDAGNSVDIAQNDSVTLLNGSISLEPEDARWRFTLSGNNLTDELYPVAGTSSVTTSTGYSEVIYARPRNFWVTLGFNF